jgi:hypothetical protein
MLGWPAGIFKRRKRNIKAWLRPGAQFAKPGMKMVALTLEADYPGYRKNKKAACQQALLAER